MSQQLEIKVTALACPRPAEGLSDTSVGILYTRSTNSSLYVLILSEILALFELRNSGSHE